MSTICPHCHVSFKYPDLYEEHLRSDKSCPAVMSPPSPRYRGSSTGDYVVWNVWEGEERPYRIELPSEDDERYQEEVAREAGERAAEMMHPGDDYFDSVEICVLNLKTKQRWAMRINVTMQPVFNSAWTEVVGVDETPEDVIHRQHREETEENLKRVAKGKAMLDEAKARKAATVQKCSSCGKDIPAKTVRCDDCLLNY